jgi:hypothetical protein
VAPSVTVVSDQTVTEGVQLSLPGIATFTDPGFNNPAGGTVESFTYSIDWGDGTTSGPVTHVVMGSEGVLTTGSVDANHTYPDGPATYTVTVTIEDDDLGQQSGSFTVDVVNDTPTLTLTGADEHDEGSTTPYALTLGPVQDSGTETIQQYIVDWGDGNVNSFSNGHPGTVYHFYTDGDATRTLRVHIVDEDGYHANAATKTLLVHNVDPSVNAGPDGSVNENQLWTQSGSFTDPGTDSWTGYVDYDYDGVGEPDWQPITVNQVLKSFSLSHSWATYGVKTVKVRIADDDGGSQTDTVLVTVNDVTAPQVTDSGRAGGERPDQLSSVWFEFSEDVSASLDAGDLSMTNDTTGSPVDLSSLSASDVSYDPASNRGTWDLSSLSLDAAYYTVTLSGSGVTDPTGHPLAGGDSSFALYKAIPGDASLDGKVDVSDLGILAGNWATASGAAWNTGDYNGDGAVDVSDLGILAGHWGEDVTVPAPAMTSISTADVEGETVDLLGDEEPVRYASVEMDYDLADGTEASADTSASSEPFGGIRRTVEQNYSQIDSDGQADALSLAALKSPLE